MTPGYIGLHARGELCPRAEALWKLMRHCELCPRMCGTDRIAGRCGKCGASAELEVASFHPHFGEEAGLVGSGGSGTIFFSHCSLRCVFCINGEISQGGEGTVVSIEELAAMMLRLQRNGCHNINLVTPTHYAPHILRALDVAAAGGLRLPLVYNTCGWERIEVLRLLDGVVDVYLADFKYCDGPQAARYSAGADTYPGITKDALLEMHRQVGLARAGADGVIRRGLMIRHLVMPNRVAGSSRALRWIGENLPRDTYVNVMSQYRPHFHANRHPEIARPITHREYDDAVRSARNAGLTNLDVQGFWDF